jgi:hypothetical protein
MSKGKIAIDAAKKLLSRLQAIAKDPDNLQGTAAQRRAEQAKQNEAVKRAKEKLAKAKADAKDSSPPPSKKPSAKPPSAKTKKKVEEPPKKQVKQPRVNKLNKDAKEKQIREKDSPRVVALNKLGDAMKAKPKKNFDPTKTKTEAGRGAARMAGAYRGQEQKGMQGAYNRLKAEVLWMQKNKPDSSYIAGRVAEMKRLNKRGKINTKQSVSPQKPPGLFRKGGSVSKRK